MEKLVAIGKFSKPAEYNEGFFKQRNFLNQLNTMKLTNNSVPIFENASVWFELETTEKINFGTHTFLLARLSIATLIIQKREQLIWVIHV